MSVRNIFSPKATRILRLLLVNPDREWGILNMSEEAETAYGHTYRILKTLEKMGLIRKTDANRFLVARPGELLNRWAAYYDFNVLNDAESYYSSERDLESLLKRLPSIGDDDLSYALTLHVGASLIAPFVRPASLHVYIKREKERLVECLGLQPSELGGNVYLVQPYDEGVFHGAQRVRGKSVVSNIQLYIDLYNYPARGREAAEFLRREVIGF